ncbi:hypothetical protein Hanom_Chr05g00417491 [Helianthus anomalus]
MSPTIYLSMIYYNSLLLIFDHIFDKSPILHNLMNCMLGLWSFGVPCVSYAAFMFYTIEISGLGPIKENSGNFISVFDTPTLPN